MKKRTPHHKRKISIGVSAYHRRGKIARKTSKAKHINRSGKRHKVAKLGRSIAVNKHPFVSEFMAKYRKRKANLAKKRKKV